MIRTKKLSYNKSGLNLKLVTAMVAQSIERPELRSLEEVKLSDASSNPGHVIRW